MRSFYERDDGQVRGIACRRLEGTNPPLAEDDVGVAAEQDVFSGAEPFLDGVGKAAFQDHRFSCFADLSQEIEILHVPRADLEDVHLCRHGPDMLGAHHFRHDQKA